MKIKSSELTGAALDWAVAKADNNLYPIGDVRLLDRTVFTITAGDYENPDLWQQYAPSIDWAQGGPIIERELMQAFSYEKYSPNEPWFVEKNHFGRHHKAGRSYARGSTILIAAMRCYVSVKLGDEVDIPDELLP